MKKFTSIKKTRADDEGCLQDVMCLQASSAARIKHSGGITWYHKVSKHTEHSFQSDNERPVACSWRFWGPRGLLNGGTSIIKADTGGMSFRRYHPPHYQRKYNKRISYKYM